MPANKEEIIEAYSSLRRADNQCEERTVEIQFGD